MKYKINGLLLILVLSSLSNTFPQDRDYRIHSRGMLHQTVYNTGELGRAWATGSEINTTELPVFEWPSRSAVTLSKYKTAYSGQHNSVGAGVWLAANVDGAPGHSQRLFAHCGAVGASVPEQVVGQWSFPYKIGSENISRVENYPLLPDGTINPAYNPNEAEEIIKASWATSLGIKVTRTSRAWSYPDYDDFIIYEYEFEYNGDTNGDTTTIEMTKTLKDVLFAFTYGFAPSMYGYQRNYNFWKYDGGMYNGDQDQFWDKDYWLTFNMDRGLNKDLSVAGKPEPDLELFKQYATNKENGGGLCSPQAPGFCVLHYDTTHLAYLSKTDTTVNESEFASQLAYDFANNVYYELDYSHHLKQPFSNRIQTGDVNSIKIGTNPTSTELGVQSRTSGIWSGSTAGSSISPGSVVKNFDGVYWKGRAKANYKQTVQAVRKNITFGPYTMKIGDKIHFTTAEVVGYGAQPDKVIEGGRDSASNSVKYEWNKAPNWFRAIYAKDKDNNVTKMTDNYLKEFGYPDYVNSKVANVEQVAHKAFQAYLGLDSASVAAKMPLKPEFTPAFGNYKLTIPFPAPIISVNNTPNGTIRIKWSNDAEKFSYSTGTLAKYKVYRSVAGMGPWTLMDTIPVSTHLDTDGKYLFSDSDQTFQIGEYRFYAVSSVDNNGIESGKTNIIEFQKNLAAVTKLGKVYAVPNPLIMKSGFTGTGAIDDKIGFYGLPKKCTIRIFSFAGNLVQTIEHDADLYTDAWFQATRNGQEIASGIYFFVVTTPTGEKYSNKFLVIK